MSIVTIKINERSSMGKAIMDLLRSSAKEKNIVEFIDDTRTKEDLFYENFKNSLKEASLISKGNKKGIPLSKTLNEI